LAIAWYNLVRKGVRTVSIPSLKKNIIAAVASLSDNGDPDMNLILVTSNGVISGTPCPEESDSEFTGFVQGVAGQYKEKYAPEAPLDGHDGCIILKDVTVQSGLQTTEVGRLVVFFDQIVGVTLGKLDQKSTAQ